MISFNFSYPWLLLLIIPAVAFALIPHLRLSKKYRRTRNRIVSIVLHILVCIMATSLLAGMTINYSVKNDENEIIILVDLSDTTENYREDIDDFVELVLTDGRNGGYKMGVVTFGFDQVYAVPLTYDIDSIFYQYKSADEPDKSASDIASALVYARDLFNNAETGKILLVTDGKETDGNAIGVIRSVSARGISVDIAHINTPVKDDDIQIVGIELPDYHIDVDEEVIIKVTIKSNIATEATITLEDTQELDVDSTSLKFGIIKGTQTISLPHTFIRSGLHELTADISSSNDDIEVNNKYYAYCNVVVYNKVLILESANESEHLKNILTEDEAFEVEIFSIYDYKNEKFPKTLDMLRKYDQVILNNISNSDLQEVADNNGDSIGFDEMLYDYVYKYGGGMFTVGGFTAGTADLENSEREAHAYNRNDMYGSVYQQMLPVQIINYTPPVGVIIIIDRSGSMGESDYLGNTKLDYARAGAEACLNSLSERDYIGVMTLDSEYNTVLPLTPRTQESKIIEAMRSVDKATGGTVFPGAIERAGQALIALKQVDKRHIIIVSDGQVPQTQREAYETQIAKYYSEQGITLSVVGIGIAEGSEEAEQMGVAAEIGHGRLHVGLSGESLVRKMREDLNVKEIKEYSPEPYYPMIKDELSSVVSGIERGSEEESSRNMTVELGGYFGVKARADAHVILSAAFEAPLYVQWKFGKGTVGSFMCDLAGVWSDSFIADENGKTLIRNIAKSHMPIEDISPSEISFSLKEDNYGNQLSIFADLEKGEKVEGVVTLISNENVSTYLHEVSADSSNADSQEELNKDCFVRSTLNANNNYSRCTFVVKQSGIYKISLRKLNESGETLAATDIYKQFSYSKEYDNFLEVSDEELSNNLKQLASFGNGEIIEDLEDTSPIFKQFITVLPRVYDPRYLFMILSIIFVLTDIAVRKFKFKWPHEIVKQIKEKNQENKQK